MTTPRVARALWDGGDGIVSPPLPVLPQMFSRLALSVGLLNVAPQKLADMVRQACGVICLASGLRDFHGARQKPNAARPDRGSAAARLVLYGLVEVDEAGGGKPTGARVGA